MTTDRWHEVDRLFRRALERRPENRPDFLDETCGDDQELRAAVAELLDAAEAADAFLETSVENLWSIPWEEVLPEPPTGSSATSADSFDRSGERLGSYRLLRRIGRGGMATVYLAERADGQWEQRVAIKVLRRGLDTEDVVRRFFAERQILSSLDHPNIARLLDGGSTPDGLPYLVMECVEGAPITDYCDERRLSVAQRLDLFRAVARAVQSAHRHLVVHRDLKPSNILVDSRGRVKLLDFGIAKILDSPEEDPFTRPGHRPLTLAYASPEQVSGEPITTSSDVYQLGLLLCELLTGHRPYEVTAVSPARAERAITEAEPQLPSELVDEESATRRSSTRPDLARTLRGDLDTIVLHALRKDPRRRYDSAGAFVDDLERYRDREPVQARPDTLGYRTRRFVDRHRGAVTAVAVFLLLLIGAASVALVQARRAERERNVALAEAAKAREVKDLLVGIFRSADPYGPVDAARGRDVTVVETLEAGAERARTDLAGRPAILGEVLASISEVLMHLGKHDLATPIAEDALRALVRAHGEESEEVASVLKALGTQAASRDDRSAARALLGRALATANASYGENDPRTAPYHMALGSFFIDVSPAPLDSARTHFQTAVRLTRSATPPRDGDLAMVLYKLATVHEREGSLEAARKALDEALSLTRKSHGSDHPNTAFVLVSDAALLTREERPDEARAAYIEALEILERSLGDDHDFVLLTRNNYALMLSNDGRLKEGEAVYREVLEARRRAGDEQHSATAEVLQNLATNLNRQGRYDEAERLLGRAAEAFHASLGPSHPRSAFPLLTQTEIRLKRADHVGAERSARQALAILRSALPEDHWITAVAECRLGSALAGQGRSSAGRPLMERALRVLERHVAAAQERRVAECRSALDRADSQH